PVVVGVEGTELSATDRERLRHPLVGMVILFSFNYESPEQLARLTAEIHALRQPPLMIAVDHEGGRVQRFRNGFTHIPPMRHLGELWDRDVLLACRVATSTGYVLASELRAHGVDFSFAPVLDLDWGRSGVIGDRAFHSDPRVVAMLAGYLTHGLLLAGMSNCGKHFPGHGWAEADSHVAVPLDARSLTKILAADAAPYRWLATSLAGVMPAHVVYPKVDHEAAGFSKRWIEEILRRELGFCGAVFSDDLLMEGARSRGDVVSNAEAALAAGCDLVLVCNQIPAMDAVLDGLRWQPAAHFSTRLARLQPRGTALSMAELSATEVYARAQSDLRQLEAALS
ncbi:MAG: beta-N-acetylhexosaminidase, partial [Burkholderiaceae bacterium]